MIQGEFLYFQLYEDMKKRMNIFYCQNQPIADILLDKCS